MALAQGKLECQLAWNQSIAVGQYAYLDTMGHDLEICHPGQVFKREQISCF